ncbi:MAG: AsmA-like C-terminal region-containing protein [Ginsengibacter sp.]
MNKPLKYTLRAFGILLGVLFLFYIFIFIYVSYNKKSIITQVTQDIGKKLNGTVTVGDVELSFFRTFPKVSVLLHNVAVTDTMFAQHHHPFFKGDEIYAELSILKLIKKESAVNGLKIKRAAIYLFTDTAGYTNTYLFKSKKSTAAAGESSNTQAELKSIALNDVRITVDDKQKLKFYDFLINDLNIKLDDDDTATTLYAKANVMVHSLAFFLPAGSFIKGRKFEGNFEFRYNKKLKQLQFDSIDIKIGGHPFNISGRFDLEGAAPQFALKIHTRRIPYAFAKSLFTEKIATALSIVDLDEKLDAFANIKGPLKGGDPLIYATWTVKNTHLTTPFFDFDGASFTGSYTDEVVAGEPRRDPNSKIVINNFSASWYGLPVSSNNIEILNLFKPVLTCDLTSNFPLTTLNELIASSVLELQSGDGSINLTYKGPLEKNNNTNSFINGVISFKDGNVLYVPRNVELKNVNGRLVFKNSDVFIEKLQCLVLNNKLTMDGQAKNLLSLVNTAPNKVNIAWNIYSPSLNLSSFIYLLKSEKKIAANKSTKSKLGEVATSIDAALDQGRVNVHLRAAKLYYKKFEGSNAIADVSLLQDRYLVNKLSMDHAGGHIDLSGSLASVKENYHQANVDVLMDNVDVNKVFAAFSNFGQDGITAQNLEGKLNAKINATLDLDNDGKAYPNSIVSVIDFSLKNGVLTNFEPVKKIQSFIFKKRDFENIRFAELKDRLEISNQEIKINRMEIESTVISMYVEGIYSMKGTTDMSIQLPLSNLKKRDANYKPENTGADKKGGSSIYIRGRPGPDGNIQFKTDLFNSYKNQERKKNRK